MRKYNATTRAPTGAVLSVVPQAKPPGATETTMATQNLRPWPKGTSGNPSGRPVGSRHKLCEAFVRDVQTMWETDGLAVLRRLVDEHPAEFVRVVASLVPKQMEVEGPNVVYLVSDHPLTDEEWVSRYCDPDDDPAKAN